jgi:hypothetical protein
MKHEQAFLLDRNEKDLHSLHSAGGGLDFILRPFLIVRHLIRASVTNNQQPTNLNKIMHVPRVSE